MLLHAALIVFWLLLFGGFAWYFGFRMAPRERSEQQHEDEQDPGELPQAA